jgi:signal transduction histidine kinase
VAPHPTPTEDGPRSGRLGIGRFRASTWLAVGACALGVLIAICLVIAVTAVERTADVRNDLVDRLYPAEAENLRLLAALVNEETGVRGYAVTRREDFLAPYEQGRRDETRAFAALERLARASPDEELPRDLAAVRRATDAWRTGWAVPVIDDVRAGRQAARGLDEGKMRFDAVRASLDTQEAGILAARAAGRERLHSSVRDLNLSLAGIAAALVVAAAGLALTLRRTISEPLERLGAEVRQVARGDLHHELARQGPKDVVELARDVESMRTRIVTELRAAEDARARLERQARDLERSNEELEQFAYVASHDLQEPLRKVASFCQLLQRRYAGRLDERADEYIAYAVDGAKRMQELITDLLTFSRVGRADLVPEPVDLDDALRDALANLARRVEETGATIEAGPLPTVVGERSLLVAIFQNLVGNALKFHGSRPPRVRVNARRDGNDWCVTCADDGIGIAPEHAERIFAIFQRLHPRETHEGTGIGLSLTRKIVEHHGGRIWLDTEAPRGTTFCFTLPVAESAT